jgi:hypothetical protein
MARPCTECDSPLVVKKSTKAKGDFLQCPQCNSEFTPVGDDDMELLSGPRASTRGNGRAGAARKKPSPRTKRTVKKGSGRKEGD